MRTIKEVHYTSDFRRAYRALPKNVQNIVDRKDKLFRTDPFYPGLKTHKLHGPLRGLLSFWVTRDYRILFELRAEAAIFYDVGTHEIYR